MVQAYLGDTIGMVLDPCSKVSRNLSWWKVLPLVCFLRKEKGNICQV